MRILFLAGILCLSSLVFFSSCKKDKPEPTPDTLTPELIWQTVIPAKSLGAFANNNAVQLRIVSDKLIAFLGDTLVAFGPDSKILWTRYYPDAEIQSNSQPIIACVADPYILILSPTSGEVECVNANSGNTIWARKQEPYEFPAWSIDPLGHIVATSMGTQLDSTEIRLLNLESGVSQVVRRIGHPPYTDVRYTGLVSLPNGDTIITAILLNTSEEKWYLYGIPVRPDSLVFQIGLGAAPLASKPFHVESTPDRVFLEFQDTIRAYGTDGVLNWIRPGLRFKDPRFYPSSFDGRSYLLNNVLFVVEPLKTLSDTLLAIHELTPSTGADIRSYTFTGRPASDNVGNQHIIYDAQAPGKEDAQSDSYRRGKLLAFNPQTLETIWDYILPDSLWAVPKRYPRNKIWLLTNPQLSVTFVMTDTYLQCYKAIE